MLNNPPAVRVAGPKRTGVSPHRQRLLALAFHLPRPLAIFSLTLTLLVLAGYLFNLPSLFRPLSDGPATNPLTVLTGLCAALALVLCRHRRRGWSPVPLAALALVISAWRLIDVADGTNHVDLITPFQAVVKADRANGLANAMGDNTALMFLLTAVAVILHRLHRPTLAQFAGFSALAIPMVSVTGYLYGIPHFFGHMSLVTVVIGLPITLATALLSSHQGVLRAVLCDHIGGRSARVQILLGYAVPLATGYVFRTSVIHPEHVEYLGLLVVILTWFFIVMVSLAAVLHERSDRARRVAERHIQREATTDPLTGLANRRHLGAEGTRELARAARQNAPVALLAFDLDHFKRINDTAGHAIGDTVLQAFARTLKANLRISDLPARLGGEEFVAVLPDTPLEGARFVAEQIRKATAALSPSGWPDELGAITVSIGIAMMDKHKSLDTLVADADVALYHAKESGRNRVVVAGEA